MIENFFFPNVQLTKFYHFVTESSFGPGRRIGSSSVELQQAQDTTCKLFLHKSFANRDRPSKQQTDQHPHKFIQGSYCWINTSRISRSGV